MNCALFYYRGIDKNELGIHPNYKVLIYNYKSSHVLAMRHTCIRGEAGVTQLCHNARMFQKNHKNSRTAIVPLQESNPQPPDDLIQLSHGQ